MVMGDSENPAQQPPTVKDDGGEGATYEGATYEGAKEGATYEGATYEGAKAGATYEGTTDDGDPNGEDTGDEDTDAGDGATYEG
jgi:hypothetical protein